MTDQLTDEKPAPAPDTHPETRQGLLLPIVIPLGIFLGIGLVLFGFSRVLLSVSPAAATVIALVVAASILGVATIVASRERLSNGTLFSMIGVVAGVAMLAGGIAIVTIGTGEEAGGGGGPQVVALAAPKGAAVTGFQPTTLSVAADEPVELDFSNQDPGHPAQRRDLRARTRPRTPTRQPLFSRRRWSPAPTRPRTPCRPCRQARSTSTARCTRRPWWGRSTLPSVAAAAADRRARSSPPRGWRSTPRRSTFRPASRRRSRSTTRTPASRTTSPSTPTTRCPTALFQGEQFPGVATQEYQVPALDPGTYYFHCDVHATMNGSVVVGPPGGGSGPAGASADGRHRCGALRLSVPPTPVSVVDMGRRHAIAPGCRGASC